MSVQRKDFVAAIEANRQAWPDGPPGWIRVLAERCTRDRQSVVAERLKVSPSMISAVLAGTYTAKGGNTANLEARVRGAYMGEVVDCPVLGEIGRNRCREEQSAPFRATSPVRAQLYHACQTCPCTLESQEDRHES